MTASLYDDLEINPRASAAVIKAAFRALAAEHHPDHAGDGARFKAVNAAYEVLSDPDKRRAYDKGRAPGKGTLIGDYRVLEQIAEGGFGITYKGEHVIVGEPVCIKHCSMVSSAHDRVLIEEARAMWDLRHTSFPAVRGMYRLEDNSLALVMSYVKGPTLEQVVDKTGRVDPETVAWITERLLNALLYLHHHGVIHGDIKPQNIILNPDNHQVSLVDFGLSMVRPTASTKSQGYTPYFAPPEQIAGKTLLPASDLYSLGALMVYALGGGTKALGRMQVPTDVPDALCAFVKSLIARDVLARPQEVDMDGFSKIRIQAFGRRRSGMKPIPGL